MGWVRKKERRKEGKKERRKEGKKEKKGEDDVWREEGFALMMVEG